MKNVLITGIAGYIGSNLAHRLLKQNINVIGIDDLSNGNKFNIPEGVRFFEGDFSDYNLISEIFFVSKIDLVFHFAAKKSVPESMSNQHYYISENASKTIRFAQMVEGFGCRYFIFASTAAVYNDLSLENNTYSESSLVLPKSPYGLSKLLAEYYLEEFTTRNQFRVIAFRFFNVGNSEHEGKFKSDDSLLSNLSEAFSRTGVFQIYGNSFPTKDGYCVRDYIHISDLIDGLIAGTKKIAHLESGYRVFNLGSGRGISLLEVAKLAKLKKPDFRFEVSDARGGDIAKSVSDLSRAYLELGWAPKYDSFDVFEELLQNLM